MHLTFYQLSQKPRIIYIAGWYTHKSKYHELEYFLRHLDPSEDVILTYHYPAQVFDESLERISSFNSYFCDIFPRLRIVLLVNSEYDKIHFREHNIECYFIHQNIFCSPRSFYIIDSPKRYDAVYNAQFLEIKRHYLCHKLDNLALIGYNYETEAAKKIINDLKNHTLLNFSPEGVYKWLNDKQINQIYNDSLAGLCLSPHEGAMYCSTEYLLSGIPVVTTPNYGGRNFFFDPDFTEFVDPDPDFVKYGLKRLTIQNIDPYKIRNVTLQKIDFHMRLFVDLINSIGFQYNKNFKFIDDEIKNFKVHKLVLRLDIDDFLTNERMKK